MHILKQLNGNIPVLDVGGQKTNHPKDIMLNYVFTAENGVVSACNVHILQVGPTNYIGFEDINHGSSVTNSSELLATHMLALGKWDPEDCLFFEWYKGGGLGGTVDEIVYTWKDNIASDPDWKTFCSVDKNPFLK